jgi:outer membrane immunogenic protein
VPNRGLIVKKLALLGAVMAALVFGVPANAADAPVKAPYYKTAPAPVFSWSGLYIGAHVGYGFGDAFDGVGPLDIDGGFAGGQLGFNWQFNRNWVLGVETDLSGADIGAGAFNVDWFGSTRFRVGYAMDRTLIYGTVGIGYAGTNFSSGHIGGVYGAGIEWAFARNWSAKVEYLYYDLGDEIIALFAAPISIEFSTVKLGVNYRF